MSSCEEAERKFIERDNFLISSFKLNKFQFKVINEENGERKELMEKVYEESG